MAEAESQHRRDEEKAERDDRRLVIQAEVSSERRGMWLAFALSVLFLSLSAFLIHAGQLAWGVGLIGVELISLVSLFIFGRNARQAKLVEERDEDRQGQLPFPDPS